MKTSSRDLQFDGLKFILIFLVVLGHLTFKDYGIGVKRLIYSFHMPVFVFLSGYFTSLSWNKDKQRYWIKKTILIYVIAQFAQCLLKVLIGFASSLMNGSVFCLSSVLKWSMLTIPGIALWYLVCLVYWRVAFWTIGDKLNDIHLFIVSCIVAILAGFVPLDYELSFQRAFAFLPFFMLGIVFKKRRLIDELERFPILYAVIGFVIGSLVARMMTPYLPVQHYQTGKDIVLRLVQTSLGFFMCIMVIRISRCRFMEVFAKNGSKTLWIYIGHTYLIILGDRVFHYLGVSFNLFTALLIDAVYCAFFIFLANQYERLRERRMVVASLQNTDIDCNS